MSIIFFYYMNGYIFKVNKQCVKKRSLYFFLVILYLWPIISCKQSGDNLELENRIEITAKVVRYVEQAYHQDFDGGQWTSFDAVELTILNPSNYRGKKLVVYQTTAPASDSFLRKEGSELSFLMDKASLSKDNDIFGGAITKVRLVLE